MGIRTKEQLTQDFETLADGTPGAVFAASERIRQHLVALEEEHAAALSRTRAGALEEAIDAARIARPLSTMSLAGRDMVLFNMGVRSAVERIRAHQDAPAPASSPVASCDVCGPRAHPGRKCPVDTDAAQHEREGGVPYIPVERVREAVRKARGTSWLKMGAEAVACDLGVEMEDKQ